VLSRLASLRFRLLLLVVVAVLPGIALVLAAGSQHRVRALDDLRDDASHLVQLLAAQQALTVESAHGILAGLARAEMVAGPLDAQRCGAALAGLREDMPGFNNLAVIDLEGNLVCAALPLRRPVSVAHRLHFRKTVETRAFATGEYIVAQIDGRASYYFGAPVMTPDGRMQALVTAGLDLDALQRRLDAMALPPGATAVVTDAHGVVMAQRPAREKGNVWRSPMVARMIAGDSGSDRVTERDGVTREYAFHPVHGPGGPAMLVAVGLSVAPLEADYRATMRRTLVGFAAVAVVAFGIALAMGEFLLVRRLKRVIGTARRLSAGDLAARTGLGTDAGEIGQLACAFDDMARSLEALTRQNRLILESAGEGILGLDAEGRISFANPAAARSLCWSPEELRGRPLRDFAQDEAPALEHAAATRSADPAMRDGAVTQVSAMFVRADGLRFPVEYVTTPICDGSAVVGAVVSFRDVSDRRRLEEQLRQAQKMEAVGQFAGGVAHDFNNLLVVILSCCDFLLEELPDGDSRRADVQEIRHAGQRAARVVAQLLAFARKSPGNPVRTDLSTVVRGIENLMRRAVGEDIEVSFAPASDPCPVCIDLGQLEQVILNLAVNARDAMPNGGRLHIETANRDSAAAEVDASEADGRSVVLRVSDTGSGMTPEVLSKIFEPFFTTKEPGRGTGLGLSTVFGIVQQANGKISVASEPGRGSTFTIRLPACGEQPRAELLPSSPRLVDGHGAAVLLVEDEDGVRRVASRILSRHGFRVIEARSGGEALTRLDDGPIDLVITDVVMPGMSGRELAAQLQRLHPRLPVVFMSGYSDRQGIRDDVSMVLSKPFTEETLLARVHEELARANLPARTQRS
jgi:two-component system, cell cycle sensor histidine kinase and response regulator CckA